ncbi:DUF72 domain-containing protein [Geobacter sp. SVR]|uniref:DUF72 domain-containing protein n=1 Tax=Geobacter sp. SVR TaxID=2495594 RepID=UPI00143F0094|nr:DUF72 domain-containing protein [Geobacter sp. SVR]BCS55237.1 histidine kinase [Geobacter sp. SVR]GCF86036.1 histidine kinase [Geobacter sp. SVR]
MNLYVGTSGYSYAEWKGTFYPEELAAKRMLHYYGQQFRTVEINNTFYRMPSVRLLEAWANEVPEHFRFVLKAPQRITHLQRLRDSGDSVAYLLEAVGSLKQRLGALLFQLPPGLRRDLPLLREFLAPLPRGQRVAFEFRHQSWFGDELFGLLRDHGAGLCIAEAEGTLEVPLVATADWGYLRLRRSDYGEAEQRRWVEWIRQQAWEDVFVFFKHEDGGNAPRLAKQFLELAGA